MPYEMFWEARGLYRRYYGRTTDLEIGESQNRTHGSGQFDQLRYVILDFLDITGYDVISSSFIDEAAALDSAAAMSNPNIKVAIVTTHPGLVKLAQAYATHRLNPYPTRICPNMDDARYWTAQNLPLKHRFRKRD